MSEAVDRARSFLDDFDPVSVEGAVASVTGLGVEIDDRLSALDIGARVSIDRAQGPLLAEAVGLKEGLALCLPFGRLDGVRRGSRVRFLSGRAAIRPSPAWLGRVINGLGEPVDAKGPLEDGGRAMALRAGPPPAAQRARLGPRIDFGVRALNAFAMARNGQRLGIFSASGLGKSQLLSMIARNNDSDVAVIALIGERGREVREFIEDNLGEDGLSRAVVVAATSDEPAMIRREAAFVALTVAEFFRDRGARVLCLMDSITRVAAAQREIGLAAGEPPTVKGYTPSVFSLLPSLLERAGPGPDDGRSGSVTGVFSVLVEGDDHDEPVADAARAILDGHIVLDRRVAERGRFPAIDILRTTSRAMPGVASPEEAALITAIRAHASAYEDMREMIRIGAYRAGASAEVDRAIEIHPRLERFLNQSVEEKASMDDTLRALAALLEETSTE
ncbi:MAG: FliI/YscN family ATPase [Parvularculaceae bacterium]